MQEGEQDRFAGMTPTCSSATATDVDPRIVTFIIFYFLILQRYCMEVDVFNLFDLLNPPSSRF